jgi:post-segregation antitoxin (ccd killing protein)|tara:strand:- start:38013 stop:38432 length:420 start_codon:yes stop_codon:yes gene_type:complete
MSTPSWMTPPKSDAELLADAKAAKIIEINDAYTAEAQPLIEDYPEFEQQSWVAQNSEARAYLAWHDDQQGDAPATPVLDNILAGRNGEEGEETLQELCLAVVDNADRFTQFQQLTGRRQRLVKAVRASDDVDVVDGISW